MDRRSLFKFTGASLGAMALGSQTMAALAKTQPAYELGVLPTLSEETPLLLNFNENSIGMAPSARQAIIDSLDKSFRYPDSQRAALIDQLAANYDIDSSFISIGNGSSENIQAVIQARIQHAIANQQAIQLVVPDPTFNYAELYAKANSVTVTKVTLTDDMLFDIPALQQAAADFDGQTVFYLCNPNNPTATITAGSELKKWVEAAPANQFFLIDEAYAEFVTDPSFVSATEWVKADAKNLVVTRTFSKLYALAGLRIGYAIADPELIAQFEAFMSLDNTNLSAAVAALASLEDPTFQQQSIDSVNRSRDIVIQALDSLGLAYVPSHANFIFHQIKGEVKTYQERMKAEHVIVGREFPPATGWNRLTLGTPAEMSVFVEILHSFREKGWV